MKEKSKSKQGFIDIITRKFKKWVNSTPKGGRKKLPKGIVNEGQRKQLEKLKK